MKCHKYSFEIKDSLRISYCKNCEYDCTEKTRVPWFNSVKFTVNERHVIERRASPQKSSDLPICTFCNEKSLFVFPDEIQVTCLNYLFILYKATGILVKDGNNIYIQKI